MLLEKLLATLNNMLLSVTAIMVQQQKLPSAWKPLEATLQPFYGDQNIVRMRKGITAHVRLSEIQNSLYSSSKIVFSAEKGITQIYIMQIIELYILVSRRSARITLSHFSPTAISKSCYPLLVYIRLVPLIDALHPFVIIKINIETIY